MKTHHIQADDSQRWPQAEIDEHSLGDATTCACKPIVETVINAKGYELLSVAHHRLSSEEKL